MQDFEKLGLFYLGSEYDLAAGKRLDTPVLYDSRDLVTHAVCVGMTGSGKTGLCLSLIEEAAIDGVPVIAIDPKGDLGNLLLTFPTLDRGGVRAVDRPGRGAPRGMTPAAYAAGQAEAWEEGAGRLGTGSGAHRAAAGRGRLRHLHAGEPRRAAGFGPQLVRRASGRRCVERRGTARRACRRDGHEPACRWPASTRRRAAASTRSSPPS